MCARARSRRGHGPGRPSGGRCRRWRWSGGRCRRCWCSWCAWCRASWWRGRRRARGRCERYARGVRAAHERAAAPRRRERLRGRVREGMPLAEATRPAARRTFWYLRTTGPSFSRGIFFSLSRFLSVRECAAHLRRAPARIVSHISVAPQCAMARL